MDISDQEGNHTMDTDGVCPEHDTVISEHGCWACGHAGPLNNDEWRQFMNWSEHLWLQAR